MTVTSGAGLRINNPFIALKHSNFRYYWIGMCVSLIGTWMQNIAQPWLAFRLTGSPFLLSLVSALQFTPSLLFSLFAGVIIDRLPKKKLLYFTQGCSMVISLVLTVLAWSGQIQYWHLLALSLMLGFVNVLDMPLRQSFVIELVGREDLMNAIALNSMVFNLSRIIGPVIAGVVMAYAGVPVCFLFNSLSFAAILVSLFFIKPMVVEKAPRQKVLKEIREGLHYIRDHNILIITLLIVAVVGTFAPNFNVLVPVFSTKILMQEATGYSLLMSLLGVGSLCGALVIAMISRTGPKRSILFLFPMIVAAMLIAVGFTRHYALTGIVLALAGFFFVMVSSNANTMMQLNTDDAYRGRVMSVYSMIFAGSTPIGNLYAGGVSEYFSAKYGFIACGAIIAVLMVPIYIHLYKKRRKAQI